MILLMKGFTSVIHRLKTSNNETENISSVGDVCSISTIYQLFILSDQVSF
jgi:hypothetical protein